MVAGHRSRESESRGAGGAARAARPRPAAPAAAGAAGPADHARAAVRRGQRCRRDPPRRGRNRPYPAADQHLRRGECHPPGLPVPWPRQPVSRGRGAEPAARASLARATATGGGRGVPRVIRRSGRSPGPGDRGQHRQAAGRGAVRPDGGRRGHLLRHPPSAARRGRRRAGHFRRRQGDHHAPGLAAPSHRGQGAGSHPQAVHPPVEGGEAQPQTHRRGRRRLRPDPATPIQHRHPGRPGHRRGQPTGAGGEEQVADRKRGRRRRAGPGCGLRRSRAARPQPPASLAGPWSTATTIRSTASTPRPPHATSRSA